MKFWILFLFSVISVALANLKSSNDFSVRTRLELKQEIQLLENNAFRNILHEQNLSKRSVILDQAIAEIQKMRSVNPVQLKADEKSISKMVQNLKDMSTQNQAQYARQY